MPQELGKVPLLASEAWEASAGNPLCGLPQGPEQVPPLDYAPVPGEQEQWLEIQQDPF